MSKPNAETRAWPRLTLALVLLGLGLRLFQFFIERALWFDEARNAVEILKPDWLLMLPPHADQPTSFGFLAVERLFVSGFGDTEWALRLFPLLAGLGAVLLAPLVARRVLQGVAIPIAVAFIALSGPAIYFSTEVKAYSSDLFFSLLLAWAILRLEDREEVGWADVLELSLLGSIAIWISYTSIFILAAGGTWLLFFNLRNRQPAGAARTCLLGVVWLANFGAYYALVIAHWSKADWLAEHWADAFPSGQLDAGGLVLWTAKAFMASFEQPLGTSATWICLAFFLAGVIRALVRGQSQILFFVGIIALTLIAGVLQLYPYQGRLLLFLAPALAVSVAYGAEGLLGRGPRIWILAAALALVFAEPVWSAGKLVALQRPFHRNGTANIWRFEGLRWVVPYIKRHQQPGDIVYVYHFAEPQYRYYAHRFQLDSPAVFGVRAPEDPAAYVRDLQQLRGQEHVWVVFGHSLPAEEQLMLDRLDKMGNRLDELRRPRARAYLYDLSAKPTGP